MENNNKVNTYEMFKYVYSTRKITKQDIANICNHLQIHLFQKFEPALNYSYIKFSGKEKYFDFGSSKVNDEDEDVVFNTNNKFVLFLKSYGDATKWNAFEKKDFIEALKNNGFTTNKRNVRILF